MKFRFFILPVLLILAVLLERADILHVSYLHIKSHELKLTKLDYDFIPGEVYYAGETISSNNYEDANISLLPDYSKLLADDLAYISDARKQIDRIDGQDLSFYSGPYQVKLCLDHKKVNVLDSSLFRKTIYLDIVGHYELWDREGCERLYFEGDQKFWLRDSVIIKGMARRAFIDNKINEIWLGQLSAHDHVEDMVLRYERPYEWDNFYVELGLYMSYFHKGPFAELEREVLRKEGRSFYRSSQKINPRS